MRMQEKVLKSCLSPDRFFVLKSYVTKLPIVFSENVRLNYVIVNLKEIFFSIIFNLIRYFFRFVSRIIT